VGADRRALPHRATLTTRRRCRALALMFACSLPAPDGCAAFATRGASVGLLSFPPSYARNQQRQGSARTVKHCSGNKRI
jgi:hypothetical protein